MTKEEFDELKAAMAAMAAQDVALGRVFDMLLMLLVRALPVQVPGAETVV